MQSYSVAVLGATGMVGQRFIQLLAEHPYFELTCVAASERSAGKRYSSAAKWYLEGEIPEAVRDLEVVPVSPEKVRADIVFSALPSSVAREVEAEFAKAGFIVASNASAYRMASDVPLLIPEVNPEHLDMIEVQQDSRGWDGAIITNPNCSTIMATLTFKPVYDAFGIEEVVVTTMQALSGAGYSGVPSMAIVDNLIPYIAKEEEKVETEALKILGSFNGSEIEQADFKISASCNRVPVLDGHTVVAFLRTSREATPEDIKRVMRSFKGRPQELGLPTAPPQPLIVREEEDRPQPRLDRNAGNGMAVTVGRVREDSILGVKYVALGHNTIRGAAGASVLNAELLVKTRKL
ncbi:MAG: aspartate-semialdehyde dehydrogenase [Euryarchaeota archaeon]|nr:aspartate-semialdehyde dehydrogenase [Euryarchaeota archaeon]